MNLNLKTNLANKSNYGGTRSTSKIKYIVVHYTANDGDTDENNGKYFHNNKVGASAHYFVDDDSVTQSVPDSHVAWHCGGGKQGSGGGTFYKKCTNTNSIGVEICDDVKNGVIYPSDKTIKNALEVVKWLMNKYNIPKERVIRHYDVTGKLCPKYWVDDNKWKSEFWNKLDSDASSNQTVVVEQNATVATVEKPKTSVGGSKVNITLNMLKNGSKGENVKALQILLNGRGYSCGTADGIFGNKTLNAVTKYQRACRLEADGIVGAKTWKAILK